jgi:hypothetical protein
VLIVRTNLATMFNCMVRTHKQLTVKRAVWSKSAVIAVAAALIALIALAASVLLAVIQAVAALNW